MKGAIVGLGFIAVKGHLPGYLEDDAIEIVAVADVTPARLELARQTIPGVRTYPDHESLLAGERELDFVDIATPPRYHAEIAIAALNRGCHVLCEKPMACSSAEVLAMVSAAKQSHRVLFPAHNYKHAPIIKRLRQLKDAPEFGEPRACTLATYRDDHAKGVDEWKRDWRRVLAYGGGGIAMDHGSHSFYLTFLFMNGYPESVTATTYRHVKKWDAEDSVTCMLRFPNGLAHVFLSWTAASRKVRYSLHGAGGAVYVDEDQLQIANGNGMREEKITSAFGDASHVSWFMSLFGQFRQAIKDADYAGFETKEAYYCVRLIEKLYESAALGSKEIPIAPELEAFASGRIGPRG